MRIDGPQLTSSLSLNGTTITDLNVFATTASFNLLTGSVATTGSNLFKGTQTISGSILPAVNNTYDLGSSTQQFRHVYISSGSLYIDGTKVLGSTSQELQITTDVGQSFKILEAGSDTITLQSNDGNITLATSGGGDVILDPTTGIIALKGSTQIYAGNRILSSDGNAIHFGNGVTISGSLLATGTNLISGSQQIGEFGYTTTSSVNTISSSINTRINSITNIQATTGSNNFVGTQTITGSLYISSDLIVQGSSSLQNITASAVNIGANIVNLNTANPAIRFAGLSIFDSGSIGGSGSFLYDAVQDEFIFIHRGDGTNITSSVVLMGAQTYNNVGSETYPTTNRLLKGTGNEHVGDSIVSETGGGIGVSGSLSVTGSLTIGGSASTTQLNMLTGSVSTQNVMAEFYNADYTSGTRNFIRVRNGLNSGGTMSSYFGQGQDGKTYIISNDFTKNHIVIDGNNTFVGINKNTPNSQLDVNGNTTVTGSLTTTGTINGLSVPNDLFAFQFLLMGS
jgi:hypothetical protein